MTRTAPPGAAPRRLDDPAREMMERPLDPGYAAAAERAARRRAGPPRTRVRSPLLVVAAVLLGLLVGAAVHALRPPTGRRPRPRPT